MSHFTASSLPVQKDDFLLSTGENVDPVVNEAITWMVNLSSGEATDQEHAEFAQWYAADLAHKRAWDRLSSSLGRLNIAAELPGRQTGELARRIARNVGAKGETGKISRRGVMKVTILGIAATTSAALIDNVIPLGDLLADHITWTGERKKITLGQGGSFVLGPRSAVKIDDTSDREEIRLLSGELFLEISVPRTHPLTLAAGDWTLHPSLGRTTLQNRNQALSAVALDRGMDIEIAHQSPVRLNAEQSLSLIEGRMTQADVDMAREVGLSKGLLVIKDGHLGDVVQSLAPYFVGIMRISQAAATIRTGGVFNLREPRTTLAAIAETLPIVVREVTPFWIDIRTAV